MDLATGTVLDYTCPSSVSQASTTVKGLDTDYGSVRIEYWLPGYVPLATINVDYGVIGVNLLVNDTEAETDDYIVKEKPAGARPLSANSPQGAADNHIPMKIRLLGPTGLSAKVLLSVSSDGAITIKKTNGDPYPAAGETVTVGTDLEVYLYATEQSSALNDVTITARTDKTGSAVCGSEDLTVLWAPAGGMSFRGSDHQGEALTSGSNAKFTNISGWSSWAADVVGKKIYHEPVYDDKDTGLNQMELKIQLNPNVVIPDVQWDIRRDVSAAYWGPGAAPRSRTVDKGETGWELNGQGTDGRDLDVTQNENLKEIFSIDAPGNLHSLPYTLSYGYSHKVKSQEWVEVKIGTNWYVASTYKAWRSVMHVIYSNDQAWIEDAQNTNEILPDGIDGWAGSWSEY